MNTADLIAALAGQEAPIQPRRVGRNLMIAALFGACIAAIILVVWLGVRPLADAIQTRMFWMKGGYSLWLAVAGGFWAARMARPGGLPGSAPLIAGAAVIAMIAMGAVDLARTANPDLIREWLGSTWTVCPWRILALAAPVYLTVAWMLRRLAPTRLGWAGVAAGLLAGGVGATVYGFYCQENTAAFVATWYTLGIVVCAVVGGLVGPRLLRW